MGSLRNNLQPISTATPGNEHFKMHQDSAGVALQRSELDSRSCVRDAIEDGGETGITIGVF